MAPPPILFFDADAQHAQEAKQACVSSGYSFEHVMEASDLLARREVPALIVLCIDPTPAGWALCGKVKKSKMLKTVPLVVTSAEAREQDFDAHRKFQAHADAYMRKPYHMEKLLEVVRGLVGGGAEVGAEISIEGEELIVDVEDKEEGLAGAEEDVVVSVEERADEGERVEREVTAVTARPASRPPLPPPPPTGVATAASEAADGSLQAAGAEAMAVVEEPVTLAVSGQTDGEIVRLREECERLRGELEEARQHKLAASPAFARDREILGLREIINKKEKDNLDLRDALDSKDRHVLDQKDKVRELERARRDLDEKLLELEKEAVNSREKVEALTQDKERGLEREKGIKVRLEEAQKKLALAHGEIDELKQKHAAEVEALKGQAARAHADEKEALLALHAADKAELEQRQAAALEALAAEQRTLVTELERRLTAREAEQRALDEQLLAEQAAHTESRRQAEEKRAEAASRAEAALGEAMRQAAEDAARWKSDLAARDVGLEKLGRELEDESRRRALLEEAKQALEEQAEKMQHSLEQQQQVMGRATKAVAIALTLLDSVKPEGEPRAGSGEANGAA